MLCGVTIGDETTAGANAAVTHDVPAGSASRQNLYHKEERGLAALRLRSPSEAGTFPLQLLCHLQHVALERRAWFAGAWNLVEIDVASAMPEAHHFTILIGDLDMDEGRLDALAETFGREDKLRAYSRSPHLRVDNQEVKNAGIGVWLYIDTAGQRPALLRKEKLPSLPQRFEPVCVHQILAVNIGAAKCFIHKLDNCFGFRQFGDSQAHATDLQKAFNLISSHGPNFLP